MTHENISTFLKTLLIVKNNLIRAIPFHTGIPNSMSDYLMFKHVVFSLTNKWGLFSQGSKDDTLTGKLEVM